MIDQTVQMVGATCLHETLGAEVGLTTDERSWAADVRSRVFGELEGMATYLEAKIEQITPGLRTVTSRYLNAVSEMFWVLYQTLEDPILKEMAERAAETCVRCQFLRAPDTMVVPTPVPTSVAQRITHGWIATPDAIDPRHVGPSPLDMDPGLRHDQSGTDSSDDGIVEG